MMASIAAGSYAGKAHKEMSCIELQFRQTQLNASNTTTISSSSINLGAATRVAFDLGYVFVFVLVILRHDSELCNLGWGVCHHRTIKKKKKEKKKKPIFFRAWFQPTIACHGSVTVRAPSHFCCAPHAPRPLPIPPPTPVYNQTSMRMPNRNS